MFPPGQNAARAAHGAIIVPLRSRLESRRCDSRVLWAKGRGDLGSRGRGYSLAASVRRSDRKTIRSESVRSNSYLVLEAWIVGRNTQGFGACVGLKFRGGTFRRRVEGAQLCPLRNWAGRSRSENSVLKVSQKAEVSRRWR